MKPKEEFIIMGLLIVWTLLLAGCTSETSDNNQNTETQQINSGDNQGPQQGMRTGMNTAFIEACANKKTGDTCILNMRNTTVNGSCTDRNGTVACQPKDLPQRMNNMAGPGGPRTNRTREGNPGMPAELPPGVDEVPK